MKEKFLDEKIKEVDKMKDNNKMYKALRTLNKKKYENPFIHDEYKKNITNPTDIYKYIKSHFQKQFYDPNIEKFQPFEGIPRKLEIPITMDETTRSIKKLNNNRAAGYDLITTEMIKYGPQELHEMIKIVLNNSLEKHVEIDIGKGILLPIPKP